MFLQQFSFPSTCTSPCMLVSVYHHLGSLRGQMLAVPMDLSLQQSALGSQAPRHGRSGSSSRWPDGPANGLIREVSEEGNSKASLLDMWDSLCAGIRAQEAKYGCCWEWKEGQGYGFVFTPSRVRCGGWEGQQAGLVRGTRDMTWGWGSGRESSTLEHQIRKRVWGSRVFEGGSLYQNVIETIKN